MTRRFWESRTSTEHVHCSRNGYLASEAHQTVLPLWLAILDLEALWLESWLTGKQ